MRIHATTGGKRSNYLRRRFELAGKPEYALLQCGADDSATFYINGRKAAFSPTWERTVSADITKLLKAGTNLIAVEYRNDRGAGGVLADIQMRFPSGEIMKLGTDADFKAADRKFSGWADENFDDSAFVPVTVQSPPPALRGRSTGLPDISTRLQLLGVTFDREKYSRRRYRDNDGAFEGRSPRTADGGSCCHPSTAAGLDSPRRKPG